MSLIVSLSRHASPASVVVFASMVGFHSGCSEEGPLRKPTVAVSGQVLVDGQPPGSAVEVSCHNLAGMDPDHPTVSQTTTDKEGAFAISTYESGDGVPPGDYAITFQWRAWNVISNGFGGPDRLKNRYNSPESSEVKFSVAEGDDAIDLGTIDLKTK